MLIKNTKTFVSIVMPCLNEEKTIGVCIDKAISWIKKSGFKGEIIIADNGSTDKSLKLAKKRNVKIVSVKRRGYGAAYLGGLVEAKGDYIVMGDSDNTYDFSKTGQLIDCLESGYDLVIGSRLRGKIIKGAMPVLHRFIGVPILTFVMNFFFRTNVIDTHSGFRAITKKAFDSLNLKTTGMEFASEMIIKAAQKKLKIIEVPITYYPRVSESKLSTFKDGWRHLRFMLAYSPTHLFFIPGLTFLIFGAIVLIVLLPGPLFLFIHSWDIHAMILGSMLSILGVQIISLGMFAKTLSFLDGFIEDEELPAWAKNFKLEYGVALGVFLTIMGFFINLEVLNIWIRNGMGPIYQVRQALLASTFIIVGFQVFFSSFFLYTLLDLKKK